MRVLWVVNRILPLFSKELGIKETNYGGGWLTGLSESLRITDGIQLAVCMPSQRTENVCHGVVAGVEYYLYHEFSMKRYCHEHKALFRRICDEFRPDVIHVFGTEYPRTLEVLDAVGNDRVLISLTGILSECYPVFEADVPPKYTREHKILRFIASRHRKLHFLQSRLISYGKNDFNIRMQFEIDALRKAKYVSGRTSLDRSVANRLNPNIKYYFCNESLRKGFYEEPSWQYDKCEKHSIFVCNAGYPIKGFHKLLEVTPSLMKKYPDIKIRVAGNSPFSKKKGLKNWVIRETDEYGKYLYQILKRNRLTSVVEFLGDLNEQRIKQEFLRANVFVLPSKIENSPNSLGEAMLLKVPCVASDVGGVSDMMVHEEEGIIYNYEDTNALAKAIDRLFDDIDLSIKFGIAASRHAAKTHCIADNNDTMIRIYRDITARNREEP